MRRFVLVVGVAIAGGYILRATKGMTALGLKEKVENSVSNWMTEIVLTPEQVAKRRARMADPNYVSYYDIVTGIRKLEKDAQGDDKKEK